MSILEVTGLSHTYGDKVLYKNASFSLNKGEHMGVVGLNGAGKSTLIGILTGGVVPDAGRIEWQPRLRLGYLDQYAAVDGENSVLEYLYAAFAEDAALEREMNRLYEQYAVSGEEPLLERAGQLQQQLEASGFYEADTRVKQVAGGLGLAALGVDRPLGELSGGQRAKAILAKLLLQQPNVLLLDEPTNFLDPQHVDWFAGFLTGYPHAFLVVSHDYAFLDRIADCICDVEAGDIRKYHGKYADFLRQKQALREDYVRQYNAQQQFVKKEEEFIRRNIAGVNTKIAQGRRKRLERLDRLVPPSFVSAKPSFSFPALPLAAQEALTAESLSVGYAEPLLRPLRLTVRGGQKLVITGFNGIGKSTLLKTLTGSLPALGGAYRFAPGVRIGYYAQELSWEDPGRTPLQLVQDSDPALQPKQARRLLARCGVTREHMLQTVGTLSGGEQAKVKLCLLSMRPCNFLVLDEPTNHLDAEAKQALREALQQFPGSVLLVSHEKTFYQDWADRAVDIADMG